MKRQGVVRISEQMGVELPWHRYTASWQPEPDAPAETFYSEDGPGWNDVEQAVAWGRQRAPIVYVRLGEGLSEIYNAGEKDDGPRNPTERWRGSRRRRARDVHPDYGGVVYIDEQGPSLIPTGKFRASRELDNGDFEEHKDEFDHVEAAVDWGRERAPVVLVAKLPSGWTGRVPTYEIRSAGEEDPEGEPLERLRPGRGQETLEWSFSTQRAVSGHEPREFAKQLATALEADGTVSNVRCELREESPMSWSFPAILVEGEEEPIAPPPIRGWIDVSFHVAAPLRKRTFEVALSALHRGLTAAGETDYGYTGNFDLHAVGYANTRLLGDGACGGGAPFTGETRSISNADTRVRVWIRERRTSSERPRWRKSTTSVSRRRRERHRRRPRTSASSNAQSALIPVHFLLSSAASAPG